MKLYLLTQDHNSTWDTYDGCVVAAHDEAEARTLRPDAAGSTWAPDEYVKVEYLGTAKSGTKAGFILMSFNAG